MRDSQLLALIKKGDTAGLEAAIDRYTAYVSAVVSNQLGTLSTPEDVEELVSDAFVALWRHAGGIKTENLRAWLGATARNAARTRLRSLGALTVPEEDAVLVSGGDMERLAEQNELRLFIERTLAGLGAPEREIFIRYYYYQQTAAAISEEMEVNLSTVKSRLARGRKKLRAEFEKEGYCCEA